MNRPAQLPLPLPEPHFGPWPGPRVAPGPPPEAETAEPDPFNPAPFNFETGPVGPVQNPERLGDWLDRWLDGEIEI
jgi:hypothetical protein